MHLLLSIFLLFSPITHREQKTNYRDVVVSGSQGHYVVRGEVRAAKRSLFYTVEDGHKEYIGESEWEGKAAPFEWKPFKLDIKISKGQIPNDGTLILHLYSKGDQGERSSSYPVVLERFD